MVFTNYSNVSFDFNTYLINGHSHYQILDILKKKDINAKVILGLTIKGKGYPIFENNNNWHHGILTDKQYQEIKKSVN